MNTTPGPGLRVPSVSDRHARTQNTNTHDFTTDNTRQKLVTLAESGLLAHAKLFPVCVLSANMFPSADVAGQELGGESVFKHKINFMQI